MKNFPGLMIQCPTCLGEGRIIVEDVILTEQNYDRFPEPVYCDVEIECEDCYGSGEVKIIIIPICHVAVNTLSQKILSSLFFLAM